MKILITENQLRKIVETYYDHLEIGVETILKLYMENEDVMVEYKGNDGKIYNDKYLHILEDLNDYTQFNSDNFINQVINYLKDNGLNMQNSDVLKKLVEYDDRSFTDFCYEPDGRPLPCLYSFRFINCEEECIEEIQKTIDLIWDYEYPMTVYRGIKLKEELTKEIIGMHWTLDKSVAERFGRGGKYVYVGEIKSKDDINPIGTIEHRVLFGGEMGENEINGEVKIVGKYINPNWEE